MGAVLTVSMLRRTAPAGEPVVEVVPAALMGPVDEFKLCRLELRPSPLAGRAVVAPPA